MHIIVNQCFISTWAGSRNGQVKGNKLRANALPKHCHLLPGKWAGPMQTCRWRTTINLLHVALPSASTHSRVHWSAMPISVLNHSAQQLTSKAWRRRMSPCLPQLPLHTAGQCLLLEEWKGLQTPPPGP